MGQRKPVARPITAATSPNRTPTNPPFSAPSWGATARRQLLVGASVLALVAASDVVIPPRPAYAVICANAGAGASSGDDGVDAQNTACGLNSNSAGSGITRNSAYGNNANASGDGSRNTAIGNASDATGPNSTNIAIGDSANSSGDTSNNIAVGRVF